MDPINKGQIFTGRPDLSKIVQIPQEVPIEKREGVAKKINDILSNNGYPPSNDLKILPDIYRSHVAIFLEPNLMGERHNIINILKQNGAQDDTSTRNSIKLDDVKITVYEIQYYKPLKTPSI